MKNSSDSLDVVSGIFAVIGFILTCYTLSKNNERIAKQSTEEL